MDPMERPTKEWGLDVMGDDEDGMARGSTQFVDNPSREEPLVNDQLLLNSILIIQFNFLFNFLDNF